MLSSYAAWEVKKLIYHYNPQAKSVRIDCVYTKDYHDLWQIKHYQVKADCPLPARVILQRALIGMPRQTVNSWLRLNDLLGGRRPQISYFDSES